MKHSASTLLPVELCSRLATSPGSKNNFRANLKSFIKQAKGWICHQTSEHHLALDKTRVLMYFGTFLLPRGQTGGNKTRRHFPATNTKFRAFPWVPRKMVAINIWRAGNSKTPNQTPRNQNRKCAQWTWKKLKWEFGRIRPWGESSGLLIARIDVLMEQHSQAGFWEGLGGTFFHALPLFCGKRKPH